MKFKPYEEYKKVDLPWIDEIPSHWEINKVKYLCKINTGTKDTIDRVDSGEYPFFVRSKKVYRINSFSYDGKAVLTAGDGDIGEIFHYIDGKFDYHQRVYLFSQFRNIKPKYFYYYLKSNLKNGIVMYTAKTTVNSLRLPWLKNFNFVLPPKEEQDKIVGFLDCNLAKIDKFVELTERQIELLKEQKEVIVNDAVTKGIDKNVAYKDSGIDWIGEIPEHWEVMSVKRKLRVLTDYTANGSFASLAENVSYLDNGYARLVRLTDLRVNFKNKGVYVSENAYKFLSKSSLKPGDFLIANVGAYTGYTCLMQDIKEKSTLGPNMMLAKFSKDIDNKFIKYSFNSQYISEQIALKANNSSAQPSINKDDFKSVLISLPSLSEQKEIVAHIEKETSKIDRIIGLYKSQIELIKEYRTSLIASAVTGKIDVRSYKGGL